MAIATSARTRQVGDAAIAVLAEQGARGLTHRAVDQAAGLPPGTTSNYARTRAALLTLALTRIAELDAADGASQEPGELAEGLAGALHWWITDAGARRRVLARFELALEATRRPELRAVYDEMGRGFRAEVVRLLAASGSAQPERDAWTLIAWLEGTAFYALAGAGGPAAPSLAALRAQVAGLLATMIGVRHDRRR
ncbi:MAG: TetR family transcriptional regulator C-terminal domain-containing protein [Streptosporangiaceae bacterium]|jgi:DNA-binding transcriptional regulator YbjK